MIITCEKCGYTYHSSFNHDILTVCPICHEINIAQVLVNDNKEN